MCNQSYITNYIISHMSPIIMDFNIICVSICILVASQFGFGLAAECSIAPVELRTEYLEYPLTLETVNPRFSWKLVATSAGGHNLTQSAFQILVSSSSVLSNNRSFVADLWDSGVVKSDASVHIRYRGLALKSRQLAAWKVRVWDENGVSGQSETSAQFGIGLLHSSDWKGKWMHAPVGLQKNVPQTLQHEDQALIKKLEGLVAPLYFRKLFYLEDTQSARLFATAKGVYEIFINGKKLHTSHFSPGYTDYHKSFRYQSFENIENFLHKGENVIGVVVGPGWYASYLGFLQKFATFGSDIGALLQLDINGTTVVQSDSTWKVTTGPIVYSDMLMGETYYVEREMSGWYDNLTFDDAHWKPVAVENIDDHVALIGDTSEPVVTAMKLSPKWMHETAPGVFIFDFGQNFAGVVSLIVPAGYGPRRIQLRHAEALDHPYMNGSLYTENLRTARAIDTLVIRDNVTESFTYTPSFTIHGFRFVEVTGFESHAPKLTDLVGNVMHSGFAVKSHMKTSNDLVNRLLLNIEWGLRSNFLSVPTDCPQRDERLGWTGDAQVFAPTAVYNADLSAFYTKWMVDMRQSQAPNGAIPMVVPKFVNVDGAPGWQDAMVVVPWVVYHTYGDEQIIEDNYAAMAKFIEYIRSVNEDFIWKNHTSYILGDWLEVNANDTDYYVLSTACYAQDALLMSKMAAVIGKIEDSKMYAALFRNISNSFNAHYVKPDGTIHGDTQTSYAVALAYSLLPDRIRPLAANKLAENVRHHKMHLTTGFLGVGVLNAALTEHGHNDVAYRLLLQDSYPSWLYPVAHGNATTIWERWDGWTKEKGFQTPSMNSFNHYSLGSVGVWLYRQVAGISSDGAGFKHILIKPNPAVGLASVSATYDSIHGMIESSWTVNGDTIEYTVSVPVNTRATIVLAGQTETHKVGSGTWKFVAKKIF